MRIVRRTDHDASFGMKGTRQVGNRRGRHRTQEHHISTRGGEPRLKRRLEHVAGDPGVLTYQYLAGAHLAERHTCSPAELEHEVRSDRVFTDTPTNTIGAKIFFAHKCSIILIRLIPLRQSSAPHPLFRLHHGRAIYAHLSPKPAPRAPNRHTAGLPPDDSMPGRSCS